MRTRLLLATILLAGIAAKADNLVANPGFEAGDFTGWTLSGADSAPSFNGIFYGVDLQDAHSGTFGAYFGPVGGVMTASQSMSVVPNTDYTISFWLAQAPTAAAPYTNSLAVSFGGQSWINQADVPQNPYTLYSLVGFSPSNSATLQFSFRNDTGFFSFDDVSVAPTPAPEPAVWLLLPALFCFLVYRNRAATARKRSFRL
jgi:hypothetical protein